MDLKNLKERYYIVLGYVGAILASAFRNEKKLDSVFLIPCITKCYLTPPPTQKKKEKERG